jgi:hypothetical protein
VKGADTPSLWLSPTQGREDPQPHATVVFLHLLAAVHIATVNLQQTKMVKPDRFSLRGKPTVNGKHRASDPG